MALSEHTLNDALGTLLQGMRKRWMVRSEELRTVQGSARRPDLLISEDGAQPLVIEHEIMPAVAVEDEARGRLGLTLRDSGKPVQVVIALRSPKSLAEGKGDAKLHQRWLECDSLEYVLFRKPPREDITRWPVRGWLRGSVRDLALLAQQAARPGEEIDALADILERQIERAEKLFTKTWPVDNAGAAAMLSEHLRLEDDGLQTRRMAMAILANALIFQQSLAPQLDGIEPPTRLYNSNRLEQSVVLQHWRAILKINYYPIFQVASDILEWMDRADIAYEILDLLFLVIERIDRGGAARSHELTGFVFQRLIADRKFLATFYTRPESAALLAALALPQARPLAGADWGDADTISTLQIGDFACGTGTLLSAVYQRLGALHELNGGDAQTLHEAMLQQVLVGCDVLPMATHLTLSMLASTFPEQSFTHSQILTMRYGRQERKFGKKGEYDYVLGSLDLLASQEVLPTLATRPIAVEGTGEIDAQERHYLPDNSFDLVIMNPPYTSPTNHAAGHKDIPNPAFAAFGTDEEGQKAMSARAKKDFRGTCANGNAGMATYFLALADRKVRDDGTLAMVLPQVMLSGPSWEKARELLRDEYGQIIVVTIAGETGVDKAFSADTNMGECLVIARKSAKRNGEIRFVTLRERPRNLIEGEIIGRFVNNITMVRQLEDGPFGGTSIKIGNDELGEMIEFTVPKKGPWQLAGIADVEIAQTAYQLTQGTLWLPSADEFFRIPISPLQQFSRIGPVHRDLNGIEGGIPRGPFDIHLPPKNPVPTNPALWGHDASRERCLEVLPDSEAIVRQVCDTEMQRNINEKTIARRRTSTRVHSNLDFGFGSQALSVAMTPYPSIGGRAWPSIIFPESQRESWEFACSIWGNSTLGILLFWWQANRQQRGRASTSVSALPALPILDLRALSDEQLAAAVRIFEDMKHCPMLPVNQIDEDSVRAELDRRLLTEVLGLPEELCAPDGPMDLLRRKLAAEPSIHGGKKSKVTLEVPVGCLPD